MESRPLLPPDELCQHVDFLQRIAHALLRDPERARDAVQDTFVRALERPPQDRSALRGWLSRVLTNRAFNELRGTRRRAEHELAASRPELGEDEPPLVERLELQRFVSDAVLALPEPRRTVVYLRYYEGLLPQAIAERLGAPLKTVKSHLHRGLGELRAQLDERSGGERSRWAALLLPLAERAAVSMPAATGAVPLALLAAAALGLVFFAWRWVEARGSTRLAPESSPGPTVAAPGSPASPVPVPAPTRESLTSEAELAALELHLTWAEDGSPAAGVGTQALCTSDPAPRPTSRRALSDAAGIARFEGLVPGPIELELDRVGTRIVELAPGEARTLALTVPDGVDVAGRVVDDSGAPVAGASIWIEGGSGWPEPFDAATSAADGSFRLRSLAYFLRFGARAPSHRASPSYTVYDLAASSTDEVALEIVLPTGGQLVRGCVRDEHGQPLADAGVWIGPPFHMGQRSAAAVNASTSGPCRVSTDARGEFTSTNRFEPGVHDLVVLADGHACFRGTVEVGDSAPGWAEVALAPPATLTGRVLGADGEPLDGALVEAEPVFPPRRGEVSGVKVELRFSAELEGEDEGVEPMARAPVVAAAGAADGAWTTSGSVRVLDGRGVAQRFEAFRPPAVRTITGADGSFALGWTSTAETDVRASVPGHPELGRATLRLASGAGSCELRLDTGLTLTGRVVDAEGRALAGYWVQALPARSMPGVHLGADTDAEGAFAFYNLLSVPHSLYASGPHVGNWTPSATVDAVPGSSGVEIVVRELEPPRGRVTGVLLGADGRVPDARILLATPAGQRVAQSERNGRTGAFVLGGFAPGRYRVQAITGNTRIAAASDCFEVEEGVPLDIGELRVEAPGALELTLGGGEALNTPDLVRDGFGSMGLVREGERFVLSDLAPGTWWLNLRQPGLFVADRPVEITSGATVELTLEPVPAFVTSASFEFPPEADPASLLRVEVRDAHGALLLHEPMRVLASPWARGLALSLPPGPAVLDAWTDAGLRAQASFDVRAGGNEVLELALR